MVLKTHEEYLSLFNKKVSNRKNKIISMQEKALERAWKNRDFEIEMY
jgi:hypothetical protein